MSLRNRLFVGSTLLAVTLIGVSSLASAADTQPVVRENASVVKRKPLILAGYTDARGGTALVRGDTGRALQQIHARKAARRTADELTNQCVAHTVLRQWSAAAPACDAAVEGALEARASARQRALVPRKLVDAKVAVAYSNRAVMHWVSGDPVAAQQDLAKARSFSPKASYVMRNLEVAGREPSLARAAGQPRG
ncbi:MAG TPA: hypothetical protein VFS13_04675 [Steroidobacteraceae bacterium]|nr:hypothetical protein [Steroidobacteraceae bacterium]